MGFKSEIQPTPPIGMTIRQHVAIQGFTIGVTWGNQNAWGAKFDQTVWTLNTQDFVYNMNLGGGTENVVCDHCIFAPSYNSIVAKDVVIGSGNTTTDIEFIDPSFDNAQLVVSNLSRVTLTKPHFEYNQNTTLTFASVSGGSLVSIYSPVVRYDPSSGSVPAQVFNGTLQRCTYIRRRSIPTPTFLAAISTRRTARRACKAYSF